MATSKLALYNNALIILGERTLSGVYENREPRKILDEVYNLSAVNACLELAKPKFALRTAKLASPTTSSVHAFDQVYTLPDDYVTIHALYLDETLETPIARYLLDENRTLATEVATNVYLRYIGSNVSMTSWTPAFDDLVAAYLADRAAIRIAPDKVTVARQAFRDALEIAVQLEGVKEPLERPRASTFSLTDDWRRVYNKVFSMLKLPLITSNSDQSEARFTVDEAINNGAVETVFGKIPWNFTCIRTKLTYDSGYTATFGYTYRFDKPADFGRLAEMSSDEFFQTPVDYLDEGDYFFSEVTPLYLRYSDTGFLTTPAAWPDYFTDLVAAEIAKYCTGLPGADASNLDSDYVKYEDEAMSTDAQRNPPAVIHNGSWTGARGGGRRNGIVKGRLTWR